MQNFKSDWSLKFRISFAFRIWNFAFQNPRGKSSAPCALLSLAVVFYNSSAPPQRVLSSQAWKRAIGSADPLAGGSYSYIPVRGSHDDMNVLAEPVGTCLFFAGEATVPAYYGTVHAAFISGVREAKRLLQTDAVELASGPAPEVGCI